MAVVERHHHGTSGLEMLQVGAIAPVVTLSHGLSFDSNADGTASGGFAPVTPVVPLVQNQSVAMRLPEQHRQLLQQLFAPWGLGIDSVQYVVKPLPESLTAQTQSENIVAFSPEFAERASSGELFRTLVHELAHIVQIRRIGWSAAAARALAEDSRLGSRARVIPEALRRIPLAQLDPVDSSFPLEALSARMGELGEDLFRKADGDANNEGHEAVPLALRVAPASIPSGAPPVLAQ